MISLSPQSSSFRRLALALVVLSGFIAYGATLRIGFMWDDHVMIEDKPQIKAMTWENIKYCFTSDAVDGKADRYFRPLTTFSNMIDYRIWKLNPFGYHLTNLLVHLTSSVLFFLIAWRLFGNPLLALFAGLFFAVHPIVVEQLLIVAGKAELFSMVFLLASILAFLRGNRAGYISSVGLYALACLGKESGIALPLFLFLIGWLKPEHRLTWKGYIPYALVAIGYMALRRYSLGPVPIVASWASMALFLIRDFPSILVHYLGTILFPTDLHSHRRMLFEYKWMYLSPLLILLLCSWASVKKLPVLWFALGWFLAGLLPKAPIFNGNPLLIDHWGYVSAAAVHLFLAHSLFHNWDQRNASDKKWILTIGVICAAFWLAMTWSNIRNRGTEKKIYENALKYPTSSVVRTNLGLLYYREGNLQKAIPLLEESIQANPTVPAMNGLALAYWRAGKSEMALALLARAIEMDPTHPYPYMNRALILGKEKGKADLAKAEQLAPNNPHLIQLKEFLSR